MDTQNIRKEITARDSVEIFLPDGSIYSGKRGTPIGEFLKALPESEYQLITGAVINGELRELTYPIDMDARVRPLTMSETDGARIYRRSVTFLLEAAFEDLFPEAALTVDHSVSSGGYFCEVLNRKPLDKAELKRLEDHMRQMVTQDLPFERTIVPLSEAIAYFQKNGQLDKVRLLKYRTKDNLVLYRCGSHRDYHHGYMLPSTGFVRWLAILPFGDGFVLQFPRRRTPDQLLPMPDYPKLLATFHQYGDWLLKLGIESVGALNDAIQNGRSREIILVTEAQHEQKIAEIARAIAQKAKKSRIVLISGPSSSGKTTFSRRLAIQILALGLSPFALEMDNYFVDRELTPKNENGEYDYEAFETLDHERLEADLKNLIAGHEVQLPRYDFKLGKSMPGEVVKLQKDQLIILEGIHGLNPKLLPGIENEQTFRLYVSCLTQLNLDRYNRVSTTDTRLIRRIVRDAKTRGYTALQTIHGWESVRLGEKNNIFPYQENANELFNSALAYELSTLKPLVEPLLRQVPYGAPEYIEAKRLLTLLEWFLPLPIDLLPDNSILREFVGGSILSDFTVWKAK
ncbi:MAG TPA: nucleoside kinase [Longilinea sp.]|nr:nucleoside kinase [Longilinea sp.]